MRIMLLATCVLVALGVAEANPQYDVDKEPRLKPINSTGIVNNLRIFNIINEYYQLQTCGVIQNQNHTAFLQDTTFVGPYSNGWDTTQCPSIGGGIVTSISTCKGQCTRARACTAFNIDFRTNNNPYQCTLLACPWPVPLPLGNATPWQGYAIAEACGTNRKCTLAGGFCIPFGETCNGNTLPAPDARGPDARGYCNANNYRTGCKCCLKPTVYMRDIENTIAYALRNRAPYNLTGPPPAQASVNRTLDKNEQEALSNFTQILEDNISGLQPSLKNFLACLRDELQAANGGDVPGQELRNMYITCEQQPNNHLPQIREWVGCKNFDNPELQQFRSYPCGVWTTFHAITVNVLDGSQQDVSTILHNLYYMVDYFPWCDDCKKHFIKMYNNTGAGGLQTAEEVTTWLWSAHNNVSHRIATNSSDKTYFEPNRPKSLFPDFKLCQDCWEIVDENCTTKNRESQVLSYLKNLYSKVIPTGSRSNNLVNNVLLEESLF